MKIALLNLQYDNNYGGNLQRYALMVVLQDMGHVVTHLNLRFNYNPEPLKRKIRRIPRRLLNKLFRDHNADLFPEYRAQRRYQKQCSVTDKFYYRYIKHTPTIGDKKLLQQQSEYDLYLVGSDQVWRKTIAAIYGIDTFFFDFLPENVRRIAYGVSLGTSDNELNSEDLSRLTPLYSRFEAVSVREDSALDLFNQYGWTSPGAKCVLDPTLLLSKDDYLKLIEDGTTHPSPGNLFCYILDPTEEKDALITEYETKLGLQAFRTSLGDDQMSVQQWLRAFYESDFIITDSYHGMVFSIIFHKPFRLIFNPFRGNARFESLMRQLSIPLNTETIDWDRTNKRLWELQQISIDFLMDALRPKG